MHVNDEIQNINKIFSLNFIETIKNVEKFDKDCRDISGTIKHCIGIQVESLK